MELFDVVTEAGLPTGETISREEAHALGVRHRTAHIWIARKQGNTVQVLLQKRAMGKDSYPGCYDTSSAGHIQAGDEPLDSALREMEEELGIHAATKDLRFIGNFRIQSENVFHGKPFRDNEVVFIYLYMKDVDICNLRLQEEELDGVRWFDLDYVDLCCRQHDPRFCVPRGGLEMIRREFYQCQTDIAQ